MYDRKKQFLKITLFLIVFIILVISLMNIFKLGESKYVFTQSKTVEVTFHKLKLSYTNINTGRSFITLQDAIDNIVSEDTQTIRVINDVTEENEIENDKNIILDLNGLTITLNDVSLSNKGTLTVVGDGEITSTSETIKNHGKLIKQGLGAINSESSYAINNDSNGTVQIDSGNITSNQGYAINNEGGSVNTTGVNVTYNFNDANDMTKWKYINSPRFTTTYNSEKKMNNISFTGGSGFEIIYCPIKTVVGQTYTITFDYQVLTEYNSILGYSGVGIQVLDREPSNGDNTGSNTVTEYLTTTVNEIATGRTITFTALSDTTYFAYNFGMAEDYKQMSFNIGNLRLSEQIAYNTKIGGLPDIILNGKNNIKEHIIWYMEDKKEVTQDMQIQQEDIICNGYINSNYDVNNEDNNENQVEYKKVTGATIKGLEGGIKNINAGSIEIKTGLIESNGETGVAIYTESGHIKITGGKIISKLSTALDLNGQFDVTIIDGIIIGKTYGISCESESDQSAQLNIGECNIYVYVGKPTIKGESEAGIQIGNAEVNFYDGSIIGPKEKAIIGEITNIPKKAVIQKVTSTSTETLVLNMNIYYAEYNKQSNEPVEIYETLSEALNNASDGNVIMPLRSVTQIGDVTLNSTETNKKITLDLNGKKITLDNGSIINNGNLTITGEGSITSATNVINNNGTIIKNGTCTINSDAGYAINNSSNGKVQLNNGNITSGSNYAINNDNGDVKVTGTNVTYDFNEANDMTKWMYVYEDRFNVNYDAEQKMNEIRITGGPNYEHIYCPIKTIVGQTYTITFDYQVINEYKGLSSNPGVGVEILRTEPSTTSGASNPEYLPTYITKHKREMSITFTSNSEIVYLNFNFGLAEDNIPMRFKIGNIKMSENVAFGEKIEILPEITLKEDVKINNDVGWYKTTQKENKVTPDTVLQKEDIVYYGYVGEQSGNEENRTRIKNATISGLAGGIKNSSSGNVEINGGLVQAEGKHGIAIHTNSGSIKISGGKVISTGSKTDTNECNPDAIVDEGNTVFEISGAQITSNSATALLLNNDSKLTVISGNITGYTYGILYNDVSVKTEPITMGKDDDVVKDKTPIIKGQRNGGIKIANSSVNFYDGSIIGPSGMSINESMILKTPDKYKTKTSKSGSTDTTTLDSDDEVVYYIEYDVTGDAMGLYTTLKETFENAVNGTIIKPIKNTTEVTDATIYKDKIENVVLDLNKKNITFVDSSIINNGKLTIIGEGNITGNSNTIDNNGTIIKKGLSTISSNGACAIKNNSNAKIQLDNGNITSASNYAIDNAGGSVDVSAVNVTYDFDEANDMNKWMYVYENRFEITYDNTTKMNSITFNGGSGYESVYCPIRVIKGQTYTLTFEYQILTDYNPLNNSIPGMPAGVSSSSPSGAWNPGTYLKNKEMDKVEEMSFTFTAGSDMEYLAFNFGLLEDDKEILLKIGNVRLTENIEYGISIGTLPAITLNDGTTKVDNVGWYSDTLKQEKVSLDAVINNNVVFYGHIEENAGNIGNIDTNTRIQHAVISGSEGGIMNDLGGIIDVRNGTIKAQGQDGVAIYAKSGEINVFGGDIISEYGNAFCLDGESNVNVVGGNIKGKAYGIWSKNLLDETAYLKIGNDDEIVNVSKPSISGETGAGILMGNDSVEFYDGVIVGTTTTPLVEEMFSKMPEGYGLGRVGKGTKETVTLEQLGMGN